MELVLSSVKDPELNNETQFQAGRFKYAPGVNFLNRILSSKRNQKFNAEELLERACIQTGLSDYGDEFFITPMKHALNDINENTILHPLGAFLYEQKILLNLSNRLWANYWIKKHAEILSPLPPALLITGLQRTGTTFMQRLLGHMPEFRGVISWEIMNPVPRSRKKHYYGMYQARIGHKLLNYINPEFKSIHSVRYDSLEEEVVLMDHSFMSSVIEAALSAFNHGKWLESQDQLPAYKDLRMWLQFLLWRKPANKMLLLKSPHHMEYLESFVQVFPQTKIVQMHRNPVKTMASYCSMVHFGTKIFSPQSDPKGVGSHWLRKNNRLVNNCMQYRKSHDDKFLDIAYRDLVADPLLVAEKIYDFAGLKWTVEHTEIGKAFCEEHFKNKYGRHVYSLDDYGLNEELIKENFGEYLKEYKDYIN